MAEPEKAEREKYVFSHKQVVEDFIKKQGLHEGFWRLYVEFALAAGNAGPSPQNIIPTAFVGLRQLGITRADEMDALTVDAAVVNPAPKRAGAKASPTVRARPSSR